MAVSRDSRWVVADGGDEHQSDTGLPMGKTRCHISTRWPINTGRTPVQHAMCLLRGVNWCASLIFMVLMLFSA